MGCRDRGFTTYMVVLFSVGSECAECFAAPLEQCKTATLIYVGTCLQNGGVCRKKSAFANEAQNVRVCKRFANAALLQTHIANCMYFAKKIFVFANVSILQTIPLFLQTLTWLAFQLCKRAEFANKDNFFANAC